MTNRINESNKDGNLDNIFEGMFDKTDSINITLDEDLVMVHVSRQAVEGRHFKEIISVIRMLEEREDNGYNTLSITFDGYDDIPDEVFEIIPIRKWVEGLFKRVPHLLYYITSMIDVRQYLTLCLCDIDSVYRGTKPLARDLIGVPIEDIPQYPIIFNISNEKRTKMYKALEKHGKKVNDEENVSEIVTWLKNLTNTPAMDSRRF